MKLFKKWERFVTSRIPHNIRHHNIFIAALILLAIPITLFLGQQMQDLRQRATHTSTPTTPPIPPTATPSVDPLSQGLIGYWKFDEEYWSNNCQGLKAEDSSQYNQKPDVCLNGQGPYSAPGIKGNSAYFDGVDDEVVFDYNPIQSPDYVTVSMWVKILSYSGNYPNLFSKPWSYSLSMYTYRNGEGRLEWDTRWDSRRDHDTVTQPNERLELNRWYHIAATYNGTSGAIYIDGNKVAERPGAKGPLFKSNHTMKIGNALDNRFINAQIDEVRLYNRALSQEEVKALYETSK